MSAILNDPAMVLRPMTSEDVSEVLSIERVAYPFPWTEGILRDCIRVGYSCWVLLRDDVIAGYAVFSIAVGEVHILNVCVDPAKQGLGYGRHLMEHIFSVARQREAEIAFLEVRESNQSAQNLYMSLGFNEVGNRPGYYPNHEGREDAIVMALSLS